MEFVSGSASWNPIKGVINLPLPEEELALETIDQTETGRRWLTMFTFLRLQLIYI